jgi:hypothetical protein
VVADLILLALGVIGLSLGNRAWQGRDFAAIARHQLAHGPMATPFPIFGSFRRYQSYLGSTHATAPAALGLAAIGTASILRTTFGLPQDSLLMDVAFYGSIPLFAFTFVYELAYFWTGVPDWMRPPAQRGWRLTKHGYELIRPEAVPPHLRAEAQRPEQEPW